MCFHISYINRIISNNTNTNTNDTCIEINPTLN